MINQRKPMNHLDPNQRKCFQSTKRVRSSDPKSYLKNSQNINSVTTYTKKEHLKKSAASRKTVHFDNKENGCNCGCKNDFKSKTNYKAMSLKNENTPVISGSMNLKEPQHFSSKTLRLATKSTSLEKGKEYGSKTMLITEVEEPMQSPVQQSNSYLMDDESFSESCVPEVQEKIPTPRSFKFEDSELFSVYCSDILDHMLKTEKKYQPKHVYLKKQKEINSLMRTKLVDWLLEVQDEYKLERETLYLAVSYVDRFLSTMFVTRAKLQLLGTTCLFLAAKYEEIYPPDVDEFAYVTADTYTKAEVLAMERMILNVFKYHLAVPSIQQFLSIFHQTFNISNSCQYLSCYFSDLTLLHERFLRFLPSVKAAAAISLAIITEKNYIRGSDILEVHYKVRECFAQFVNEIYLCLLEIADFHSSQENNDSCLYVREKYANKQDEGSSVGGLSPPDLSLNFGPISREEIAAVWTG